MKIDLLGGFKFINELYTVKIMTTAERILIRQKKDLLSYIAIHLVSIIKTFLVFGLLLLLVQYSYLIPIDVFWFYVLTGLVFLIIDPLGIRALIFLIKKYIAQLFRFILTIYNVSVKKYFQSTHTNAKKHNFVVGILYWLLAIITFSIPLVLILIKLLLMASIYILVFFIITLLGNEAFSLIITNTLSYIIPLDNEIFLYSYYFLSIAIIYIIIDYRIRQTSEVLVVDEIIEDGRNEIEGLELISTNGKINIFIKDKKYLVFDQATYVLTLYAVNSKYTKRRKALEEWIRNRIAKKDK
ncbi:MAG: hypothetical protein RBQ78_06045 [Acholeplasmataceae bacterium]|jgi:hypothetical protein|nr:hypothetical protein [Acholeplasmataceae bacterium]